MDMTNQDYGKLVNQYSQSSPLGKNMVWAFLVGGAICTAGQGLSNLYQNWGMDQDVAGGAVSITLILAAALLTGLLAKESIISTLAVLAGQGSIRAALSASLPTPAAALALMTFVLLYPPCAAASASIIKGLKSRKLSVLMVTGQCLLAWICAWIAYRLAIA